MKPSSHLSYKYQYNFSDSGSAMYDQTGRRRKAITMVAVLEDYLKNPLKDLTLLNIGSSTGIIDQYLAQHLGFVISVDIDQKAIHYASEHYTSKNLQFVIGDAMQLSFTDNSFDLAICSQVYEHVPNADQMMAEIYRVLKPGGICYFAAGNKIMLIEPHYNLPFLSLLPKPLADLYIKASGKGNYYYEKHLTIWGLKKIRVTDYNQKMALNPNKFKINYMLNNKFKIKLAIIISKYFNFIMPGYIWILEK